MADTAPPQSLPSGPLTRWARFVLRFRVLVLVASVLLTAVGGLLASRLELRTNFAELLPSDHPAVKALREMQARIDTPSALFVVVTSPNPEANRRYIEEVGLALRKLPKQLVGDVAVNIHEEKRFVEANRWLYADLPLLQEARDALRSELERKKNPLLLDLDDGPSLSSVEKKLRAKADEAVGRFPDGYFTNSARTSFVAVIRPPGGLFAERAGEGLVTRVRELLETMPPTKHDPRATVDLSGDVLTNIAERAALENDLVMATGVCVALVALAVFVFYGRLRSVPLMAAPALMGSAWAFGLAQLLFGYLNSSTAFLGTIIVGNGINFAIIFLARYEEERDQGRSANQAIETAIVTTTGATFSASTAAAIAYGSLMATRFRGFNQFGAIGGCGMVLCWVATLTVLPAVLSLFDQKARGPRTRLQTALRGLQLAGPLGRLAARRPAPLLALGTVITLVALVPMIRFVRDPFEYNFARLRNARVVKEGAERLTDLVDGIMGRTVTPQVLLADRPDQVIELRQKLLAQDTVGALSEVRTIYEILPGVPELQRNKLAVLNEIRALLEDKSLALLDDQERAKADGFRPPAALRVLLPEDLPPSIRERFRERDGRLGTIVMMYPGKGLSVWNGRDLIKIAKVTQQVKLHDGAVIRSSGNAVVFAGMVQSITRDGPIATLVALGAVALLVLLVVRGGHGLLIVLGALFPGIIWMLGGCAAAGVKVNFLNFIALPITFGIGVDYAINIYLRYRLEGRGSVERVVSSTGGAVALCSLTTIIGYSALLVADNRALVSFGSVAIFGEIACLAAALLFLPATLTWLEQRRGRSGTATARPPAPVLSPAPSPMSAPPRSPMSAPPRSPMSAPPRSPSLVKVEAPAVAVAPGAPLPAGSPGAAGTAPPHGGYRTGEYPELQSAPLARPQSGRGDLPDA
jgi:hypothetical protein